MDEHFHKEKKPPWAPQTAYHPSSFPRLAPILSSVPLAEGGSAPPVRH